MNPTAIVFFGICACIGFLVGGVNGAVVGLLIALCLSFLASL